MPLSAVNTKRAVAKTGSSWRVPTGDPAVPLSPPNVVTPTRRHASHFFFFFFGPRLPTHLNCGDKVTLARVPAQSTHSHVRGFSVSSTGHLDLLQPFEHLTQPSVKCCGFSQMVHVHIQTMTNGKTRASQSPSSCH